MHEVFISYSRKDRVVVERLRSLLEGADISAWVDETHIAPAVNWRDEINHGIATKEALIVIVSPDFVASRNCHAEVDLAVAFGKRIIPVACRDTDPATTHRDVESPNWIFCRTEAEWAGVVDDIAEALRVDPDWTKQHTRLLGDALEWERQGRDPSILLSGSELQAAETAVNTVREAGQPQVTDQQRLFVQASRIAAARRTRTIAAIASIVAVVSIALAAAAVVQTFEANDQRRTAEQRERVAESRSLAAQAIQLIEFEPDTAALLAAEALRLEPTAQARDALLTVLASGPSALATLEVDRREVDRAASIVDSTGRFELSANGSVVTDTSTGATQQLISLVPDPSVVALRDTKFDSAGTRMVFHNLAEFGFEVFDIADGLPGRELPSPGGSMFEAAGNFPLDAAYRSDGRLVVLWTPDEDAGFAGDKVENLVLDVYDDDAERLFSARFSGRFDDTIVWNDAYVVLSIDDDLGAIVTTGGSAQLFSPSNATLIGPLLSAECSPASCDREDFDDTLPLATLDRDLLVTTDHVSIRRSWTMDVDDWIEAACEFAGRELTAQERTRFLSPDRSDLSACTT